MSCALPGGQLRMPERAGLSARQFISASRGTPEGPLILIDDVLTTGATLAAARLVLGYSAISGVTATSAGRVVV